MAFEQATIKVEKEREFGDLRDALLRVFSTAQVVALLKRLDSKNIRVRDLDAVLSAGVIEKLDAELGQAGKKTLALYQSLTVSDQAQLREFYLSKLEEVDPALRTRFNKVYRYY
jgi:type III secretory pathway component EscV